jgi:hypothetical protein
MSWVRVDDKAWSHPKFAGLSGNAVRLWLFATCWSAGHETDGKLPKVVLRILGAAPKDAAALVDAGLWHKTEDGWGIHDFLEYQPSAADNRTRREAKAQAGRAGGVKSGQARAEAKTKQVLPPDGSKNEAGASGLVEAKRTPDPDPDPDPDHTPIPPPGGDDAGGSIAHDDPLLPCPSRLAGDDLVQELANHYKVTVDAIRQAEQGFKTYWTVGGGSGSRFRRGLWLRKFRQRVQALHERNELGAANDGETTGIRKVSPEDVAAREARDEAHKAEARRKLGLA